MSGGGALVIFVKTPGCSPVKTRLARSIGRDLAEEFYLACLKATSACAKEVQRNIPALKIYWAVAEQDGTKSPLWLDFPVLYQGEGSLGVRLANVYREVLARHEFACFIGADSPHVRARQVLVGVLETARNRTKEFILGETSDGGFYFFGGGIPVPDSIWCSVEYSTSETAKDLAARLSSIAGVTKITSDFDIDTIDDLARYANESVATNGLLPEQLRLIDWVKTLSVFCKGPSTGRRENETD